MSNADIEAPVESTPLIATDSASNNDNTPRASPITSSADSTIDTSATTESSIDGIKEELDQPWPATFDRGIQILAGPVFDEEKIDFVAKSPSVRARYRKKTKSVSYCAFVEDCRLFDTII